MTDGMQSTASTLFNGMWNMAVCWSLVKNCSVSPPFKYRTPFTYPYGSWSVAFALWAPCVPLFPDIRYLKSITNNARAQTAMHINRNNAADLSMFMNAVHLVIMCYVTVRRCGGHRLAFSQPSFLVLSVLFYLEEAQMIPLSIFSSAIVAVSTPLTAAAINIDASNVNMVLLRTLSFESHVIFFHSFFTPPKNDLLFVIFLPGSEPVPPFV